MITKMTKYSFIVFHKETESFLSKVQELGMVDITRENKAVDAHSREMFDLIARYSAAIKNLSNLKEQLAEIAPAVLPLSDVESPLTVLQKAEKLLENREAWSAEEKSLQREREEALPWGIFDREDIKKVENLGYTMHFYAISETNFNEEWEKEYLLHIISRDKGKCYFTILLPKGEELRFKYPENKFPALSYHLIDSKIDELRLRIAENNATLAALLSKIEYLENGVSAEKEALDLYLAGSSSIKEAEGTICVMTGFAPAAAKDQMADFLKTTEVYYIEEDAVVEDNPPIKLKNTFFTRLFEPIGELYMLPKYGELDLTPYFAPFYMLFFGLCLGDMGYGLVLILAGTIGKFKMPSMKGYLTLIQLLGLGSFIMPMLNGVFFGAKIGEIFPVPDAVKGFFFTDIKMFWFAIIFGLFQIVFARMVNAIDSMIRKGWQHGMHNIGWSIVIIWASLAYAGTMLPELVVPAFVNYIGYLGLALIIFFSSTEGNIISRMLKGTFALYDITGIFGDMLSYIRLFGLGTAGGILGMVVNSVAMNMSGIPYIGWFFTGLMLLIGHTAVLLLSSLGAFVHPMRLTFVEFYKNAGFGGGGKAFRPLAKNQ